MRMIVTLFATLCLCAVAASCSAGKGDAQLTALLDLAAAPQFDLKTPDGSRVRLSDFRGKPLIVNFWATWCPPCRAEMPSFQRAWEQLEAEGIGVIAINVGEDAETIGQFTDESPVTFPLPMDEKSQTIQAWPVSGVPTTFVVDAKGRLAYVATGEREWDDPALLELVRALARD
jgi:peroxiredoxin